MRKRRERKKDFERMRNTVLSITRELVQEQLSHAEWLERLDRRVYKSEEMSRLSWNHVGVLHGMVRGVEQMLHLQNLVWCHWYKGKFQTSEECQSDPKFSYDKIIPEEGRHCWRDSRKPF